MDIKIKKIICVLIVIIFLTVTPASATKIGTIQDTPDKEDKSKKTTSESTETTAEGTEETTAESMAQRAEKEKSFEYIFNLREKLDTAFLKVNEAYTDFPGLTRVYMDLKAGGAEQLKQNTKNRLKEFKLAKIDKNMVEIKLIIVEDQLRRDTPIRARNMDILNKLTPEEIAARWPGIDLYTLSGNARIDYLQNLRTQVLKELSDGDIQIESAKEKYISAQTDEEKFHYGMVNSKKDSEMVLRAFKDVIDTFNPNYEKINRVFEGHISLLSDHAKYHREILDDITKVDHIRSLEVVQFPYDRNQAKDIMGKLTRNIEHTILNRRNTPTDGVLMESLKIANGGVKVPNGVTLGKLIHMVTKI